jgi:hypothetical protein
MSWSKPSAPGPSAALEAELEREFLCVVDPLEKVAIADELHELRSRAWNEPVPEEDAEWARLHREQHERNHGARLREFAGYRAYKAYLESSGGLFGNEHAPPEPLDPEPWREFGNRVRKAAPAESEEETLAAALAGYAQYAGKQAPAPLEPFRAAVRAVRESFKKPQGDPPRRSPRPRPPKEILYGPTAHGARGAFDPIAPGPSAAREAELVKQYCSSRDPVERAAMREQLERVMFGLWREPVPEEDAEWARIHRGWLELSEENNLCERGCRWAYAAYLESSGGVFDGEPAPREPYDTLSWSAFGNRVRKAPAGEPEEETLAAALADYGRCSRQPLPPPSEHWLAAARAVRARFEEDKKNDPSRRPIGAPAPPDPDLLRSRAELYDAMKKILKEFDATLIQLLDQVKQYREMAADETRAEQERLDLAKDAHSLEAKMVLLLKTGVMHLAQYGK